MPLSASALLNELAGRGVHLYVRDGRLRAITPKNAMTDELRQLVQAHRGELIALLGDPDGGRHAPILPVDRGERLPLSFAQQRLWFLAQLEPGSVEYNAPMPVWLGGGVDVGALGVALGGLVARHEVLRTRLVPDVEGVPWQVIDAPGGFDLPVVDLSGRPDPGVAAREWLAADAVVPFDLAVGPLFRATLLRLGVDEHVLAIAKHHVVGDEWSAGILRRELEVLYAAAREGVEPGLPELPVQYADFAVWQRGWLTGEVLADQLGYWRGRLAGAPVLELPTDRPRPVVRSAQGGVLGFTVPAVVADGLRALSREAGATMFMTVFAAFTVLLSRYSGQDDIVVGTPIANRNRAEIEPLIGFFVNTLVLRTDLSGDPTFTEVLGRVRAGTLAAYAHQDVPFEQLVDELGVARDRSRTPLFQVLFNYVSAEAAGAGSAVPGESEGGVEGLGGGSAVFDLTVSVGERGGVLVGGVEFSTALWDESSVRRLVGHFQRVLGAVAVAAGCRLSRLPLLSPVEAQGLRDWSGGGVVPVPSGGVHDLVSARAAADAGAVAVVGGGESVTYGELEVRANRLAHHLRGLGVGPDTVVGLCLSRGVELVVAMVAVWKAGAGYLALDPDYPPERLAFMVADSGVSVLLGHRAVAGRLLAGPHSVLGGDGVVVVWLDDAAAVAAVAGCPAVAAPVVVAAGGLACVIYTSGSTGQPKASLVTHGSLLAVFAGWCRSHFGVDDRYRWLSLASASFDVFTGDVVRGLGGGGGVVVGEPGAQLDAAGFAAVLERDGVQAVECAPQYVDALVEFLAGGGARVGGLRLLVVTTQVWRAEAALRASRVLGGRVRVLTAYGVTEATIDSTVGEVGGLAPGAVGPLPVGAPLPGSRLHVLDRFLNPVPVGVVGELFLGGPGLTRGYGGCPELTGGRFVADPLAGDGSRLYRTGDLGRWRPDGQVEFLGRADTQVKVRGFRVEAGEVEHALLGCAGVAAAVVLADAQQRLVAYVVPVDARAGVGPAGGLRSVLAARLPEFMIPSVFVEVAALPLTPNGKVDRAALAVADGARVGPADDQYVAPSGPVQEVLAGIWAQILGVARVGAHDDFFALGGHSLLATQVVSRVRAVFEVEVAVAAVFDAPTVAGLAAVIDTAAAGAGTARVVAPPVVAVGRGQRLPLSFAQQRLWFLTQLEPDSVEYNTQTVIWLGGGVDPEAVAAALGGLVARHEVLRTRLVSDADGVPWQVVDAPAPVRLPVVDLCERADPQAAARQWLAADEAVPFDLAVGPLLRAALLRLAADEHVLVLAMHHVVGDEWSAGILRRELEALYAAAREGVEPGLPELPVQYADFAVWQRGWLTGEVLAEQVGYWRGRLAGAPVLELPTERPRPAVRSNAGAVLEFTVAAEVVDGLRALSRGAGATMFMTVFAAFTVLLSRYSGQDDIVVGTPIANRNRAEIEPLIGFFVNTLVLRTDLSGDPTFLELVRRVRAATLAAYAHQDVPFERLVDELVSDRDRSRTPLFQVLFNYFTATETATAPATPAGGGGGGPDPAGDGRVGDAVVGGVQEMMAKFDLRLIVAERGGGLVGGVHYATGLFDEVWVRGLVGHFLQVLTGVGVDGGARLSGLVLEVAPWPVTRARVPAVAGVQELVDDHSDRPAVVVGGESFSYRLVQQRANQLAHYLRSVGVGPESVVGLAVDRGVDVVVGVLAVWRAGAGYLMLDTGMPVQRCAFVLAEGGVSVVVGTARLVQELPVGRLRTVVLDDPVVAAAVAAMPAGAPAPAGADGLDRVAYVMFTSGSTGRPKAVVVTQRGLLNYVAVVGPRLGIGAAGGSYALLQPPTTDFANTVLFTALSTGGCVHVLDPQMVTDGAAVAAYLAEHRIDYLKIVPSHLAGLAEAVGLRRLLPGRVLVLGGEATPPGLAAGLLAVAGPSVVANHYGPTETTVGVATTRLEEHLLGGVALPVGSALPNTRLLVLDRSLNPVPAGVPGELYVGGAGVARGYRGRPELTGQRFVADPSAGDGSRLYRTGDLVKRRPDGLIVFLGRVDDQVKVRGYRIEPAEVQAVLAAHPGVGAAVVVADGEQATRRLVAYLVPADPGAGLPAAGQLRTFAAARLPEYMIPAVFVELAALPLTGNGKLDRAALPTPQDTRPDLDQAYTPPQGPTQQLLAGIWAQVLGIQHIGAHDNFFDMGGHSLLAAQVIARLRGTGREISVGDLFDHPTIAGLAPLIGDESEAGEMRSVVEIRRGIDQPPLFVVHSGTGGVTDYTALAAHFADGQRVIGLQSRGWADDEEPLATVEEMARAYLGEIRRVQPEGPYLLAGWSMGGYVALEMARQLGADAADVFLVGPPLHRLVPRRMLRRERTAVARLVRQIDKAIEGGTPLPPEAESDLLASWNLDDEGVAAVKAGDAQQLRAGRVGVINALASVHYRMLLARRRVRHGGRVVLYLPEEDEPSMRDATLKQWFATISDQSEVVYAPGTHLTMVRGDEGARFLGGLLSAELVGRRR
jgi:amino acid adenylation domain-containing protein